MAGDSQVEREQLRTLYRQTWVAVFASLVVGAAVSSLVYVLLEETQILAWLGLLASVNALRLVVALVSKAYLDTTPRPRTWMRAYALAALGGGLTWGWLSLLYMDVDRNAVVFCVVFLGIGGTVSGAVGSLGAYLPAYWLFALGSIAPITVRFMLRGDVIGFSVSTMSIGYLAALMLFVRNAHRTIIESVKLRFANDELVQRLTAEMEKALAAQSRAEDATLAKSRFLAAASHDLRQPVYALSLFTGTLRERAGADDSLRYLAERIAVSCDALKQLLDGLLDISRLDAGTVLPSKQAVPLGRMMNKIAVELSEEAAERGVELRVAPTSMWIHSDPDMLERMLRNLVSNAIRYSEDGKVLIGCRRGGGARLCVWDQGVGIPPDKLDEVFVEFTQLENPERDRSKGLGLGLAIVRRLGDLLDHEVEVVSELGRGSCFSVRLDVAQPSPLVGTEPEVATENRSVRGLRVLVIDDEQLVRDALHELLTVWGCRVFHAGTTQQAAEVAAGEEVDLVLADYRLRQHETGYDAVRAVRAARGREVPAVITTGDTGPTRIREAESTGLPLLHKPLTPQQLFDAMCAVVEPGAAER